MKSKNKYIKVPILLNSIIFISWGNVGHRIVNGVTTLSFPPEINFLLYSEDGLVAHDPDADCRKGSDPSEDNTHYIDIDNFPDLTSEEAKEEVYEHCKYLAADKRFVCPQCNREFYFLTHYQKVESYVQFLPTGKYSTYPCGEPEEFIHDVYFECPECCQEIAKSEKEALKLVKQTSNSFAECEGSDSKRSKKNEFTSTISMTYTESRVIFQTLVNGKLFGSVINKRQHYDRLFNFHVF